MRINIYVPDDMKARMDKLPWINWSEVAQKAFDKALSDAGRPEPTFMVFGLANISPEDLHNVIADAVGEPRVHPNSGRNLRKDPRTPKKAPGGNSDDGTPEQSK